MAQRFKIPAIPKGEEARYGLNLYEPYLAWGGMLPITGKKGQQEGLLVKPLDPLLIQKGGIQAFIVYNKLLFDEYNIIFNFAICCFTGIR